MCTWSRISPSAVHYTKLHVSQLNVRASCLVCYLSLGSARWFGTEGWKRRPRTSGEKELMQLKMHKNDPHLLLLATKKVLEGLSGSNIFTGSPWHPRASRTNRQSWQEGTWTQRPRASPWTACLLLCVLCSNAERLTSTSTNNYLICA